MNLTKKMYDKITDLRIILVCSLSLHDLEVFSECR